MLQWNNLLQRNNPLQRNNLQQNELGETWVANALTKGRDLGEYAAGLSGKP